MARIPYKFKTPRIPENDKLAFALLRCTRGHTTKDIWIGAGYIKSRSTIDKIRRGKTRYPRFMTVVAIVHACGLKMANLLEEIEYQYPTPSKKSIGKYNTSKKETKISEADYASA